MAFGDLVQRRAELAAFACRAVATEATPFRTLARQDLKGENGIESNV